MRAAPVASPERPTWATAPTQSISAGGVAFAYRELGKHHGGTPLILLVHLAAVLDNWDPRVVDGLAAQRHVIAFDNRGVGASSGSPSNSMEQMADDAITFIKAKGYQQVDLFGFSMGGMIAQEIALKEPDLVRKMILAGTGPAGGEGITVSAYVAQLQALSAWGKKAPADLSRIRQPVLVVNGDNDRMVPTINTHDLARRLPNSQLIIYPDAGHGGVFQFHAEFVMKALGFLAVP